MIVEVESNSEAHGQIKVGVAPLRKFSGPLITKIYATTEEWWQATIEASNRMVVDEEFRKEIEEFSS